MLILKEVIQDTAYGVQHSLLWAFFVEGVTFATSASLTVNVSQGEETKDLDTLVVKSTKRRLWKERSIDIGRRGCGKSVMMMCSRQDMSVGLLMCRCRVQKANTVACPTFPTVVRGNQAIISFVSPSSFMNHRRKQLILYH